MHSNCRIISNVYRKVVVILIVWIGLSACGGSSGSGDGFLVTNHAPNADAGGNQNTLVGTEIVLYGSASSDPDGGALVFLWTVLEVPDGSQAVLSDPAAPNPSFVADLEGPFVFSLQVSDPLGATASDMVAISASVVNAPPNAVAVSPLTSLVDNIVILDGSGSQGADGNLVEFSWTLSRPAGSESILSGPTTMMPTFVPDVVGHYVALLRVTDSDQREDATIVTVDADVAPVNSAPLAQAGDSQEVNVGDLVILNGLGSNDPNGDPLLYSWSFTYRPADSTAALSALTIAQPYFVTDRAGPYVLSLVVSDGELSSEADNLVIVSVTSNNPPIAYALVTNSIVYTGDIVVLSGLGSQDRDIDSLTYAWSLVSFPDGSTAKFDDLTLANPTFVADKAGEYMIDLRVSDGISMSLPYSVKISVLSSP